MSDKSDYEYNLNSHSENDESDEVDNGVSNEDNNEEENEETWIKRCKETIDNQIREKLDKNENVYEFLSKQNVIMQFNDSEYYMSKISELNRYVYELRKKYQPKKEQTKSDKPPKSPKSTPTRTKSSVQTKSLKPTKSSKKESATSNVEPRDGFESNSASIDELLSGGTNKIVRKKIQIENDDISLVNSDDNLLTELHNKSEPPLKKLLSMLSIQDSDITLIEHSFETFDIIMRSPVPKNKTQCIKLSRDNILTYVQADGKRGIVKNVNSNDVRNSILILKGIKDSVIKPLFKSETSTLFTPLIISKTDNAKLFNEIGYATNITIRNPNKSVIDEKYLYHLSEINKKCYDDVNLTDVAMLYKTIHKLSFSSLKSGSYKLISSIFKLRHVVTKYISDERKISDWTKSLTLLQQSIDKNPSDELLKDWLTVLSSRYVFDILMNCVSEKRDGLSKLIALLKESRSWLLFTNELYSISYLFTPFHCRIDFNYSGLTETKLKSQLTKFFNKDTQNADYVNIDDLNWICQEYETKRSPLASIVQKIYVEKKPKMTKRTKKG